MREVPQTFDDSIFADGGEAAGSLLPLYTVSFSDAPRLQSRIFFEDNLIKHPLLSVACLLMPPSS